MHVVSSLIALKLILFRAENVGDPRIERERAEILDCIRGKRLRESL
jgi:hypothetical protein